MKDTIVRKYFHYLDSRYLYHDTTNFDYKILKAYVNNDSVFLQKLNNDVDISLSNMMGRPRIDSCVDQHEITELGADEVYRFTHGESFCFYHQVVTVSKTKDLIKLHYAEYSNGCGRKIKFTNGASIEPYCKIEKEFEKGLSINDWNQLEEKVYQADIWGLKPESNSTTDGSFWTFDAFTKQNWDHQQFTSVYRHCPCNDAFTQLGHFFMALAGEKSLCGEFY